jgi:hypothetical protein
LKSNIFFILLSLFLVKLTVGQAISKSEIVKFKIKSITAIGPHGEIESTRFYNDKGDLIKDFWVKQNDQFQNERELFYNDYSQLIEERTYTASGVISMDSKYYYNDKNQLFKKEYISLDKVSATLVCDYDGKGNKISETETSATGSKEFTKYKYDDKNFLIQEDKSYNTTGKDESTKFKYNDKGQVIEKKIKLYLLNANIKLTYSYNDIGRLTKVFEKSSNGVSSTNLFDYNDKGLLVSDTWESSMNSKPIKRTYQMNFE